MCAEPVAPESLTETFDNAADRQPTGVGRNNCRRLANRFDLLQQLALNFEVLGNRFDDPVGIGEQLEIVFEVSCLYQSGERWIEKGRRL